MDTKDTLIGAGASFGGAFLVRGGSRTCASLMQLAPPRYYEALPARARLFFRREWPARQVAIERSKV